MTSDTTEETNLNESTINSTSRDISWWVGWEMLLLLSMRAAISACIMSLELLSYLPLTAATTSSLRRTRAHNERDESEHISESSHMHTHPVCSAVVYAHTNSSRGRHIGSDAEWMVHIPVDSDTEPACISQLSPPTVAPDTSSSACRHSR